MKHTMTVQELILLLQKYPAGMPVFGTWEGVFAPILAQNFECQKMEDRVVLVIDVETY